MDKQMTKVEMISDLFLDFNKDPYKNKPLVEHYVKRLSDCPTSTLEGAIRVLSNERDMMPRCKDILAKCNEFKPRQERTYNSDYCELCGDSGAVKGVFVGNTAISSLNFLPEGSYCYSAVIGRCQCEARNNWSTSLPIVEPSKFLYDYSAGKDVDCSRGAMEMVIKINKGFRCQKEIENNTLQSTPELEEGLPF